MKRVMIGLLALMFGFLAVVGAQACPPVAVPSAALSTGVLSNGCPVAIGAAVTTQSVLVAPLVTTVQPPVVVQSPVVIQQQAVRARVVQPRQVTRQRSVTRIGGLGMF